jgi:hypothetical protein
MILGDKRSNSGYQPRGDGIKLPTYALDSMWTGISNNGIHGSAR